MNISKDSGEIIKLILPKFKECMAYKDKINNKKFINSLNKLLLVLYNDILKAEKFVSNKIQKGCVKGILKERTNFKKPDIYSSKFFQPDIKEYVEKKGLYQLVYNCFINKREISIIFTLFSRDDLLNLKKYDEYVRVIYIWLYICEMYSQKSCANTLNIYIYLTPFKKILPNKKNTTIGINHVNTAFTLACAENGEIVLFREEEWMKVFIHETFHSYGLDFGSYSSLSIKSYVKTIFPIDSEFNIEEAYSETWARIINSAFVSYNSLKNKYDKKEFLIYMNFSLQVERLFSLYQCNKILQFMGLSYQDMYSKDDESVHLREKLYREETNVFSYYVLTCIFMSDYYNFMKWCEINNINLIRFNSTERNFIKFGDLINKLYNSENMKEGLICISNSINNKVNSKTNKRNEYIKKNHNFILNTMRMSSIELL